MQKTRKLKGEMADMGMRRILSLAIILTMMAGALISTGLPVYAADTSALSFAGGDGTAGNPYQIATEEQLDNVRNHLNKHFIQTAEIDLAGMSWVPIGDAINRFTGSYDGRGYTIFNLKIEDSSEPMVKSYVGLFGHISNGAHLKNIKLQNADVEGKEYVGSLVGWSNGGIICNSSSVNLNVTGYSDMGGLVGVVKDGGLIADSYSTGEVTTLSYHIKQNTGGLVGFVQNKDSIVKSIIERCYSTANVTGYGDIGGLVGDHSGVIKDSYATGNITAVGPGIGGLVGNNRTRTDYGGEIVNSFSTGIVIGTDGGGLVGRNEYISVDFAITQDSFWDTEASFIANSAGGTGKSTGEMKTAGTFANWDFGSVWKINGGYPYLRNPLTISGFFTVNDKVYDGNAEADIVINGLDLTGIQTGDDVTLVPVAAFADSEAGVGKTVSLSNSYLTGANIDDYILLSECSPTATADILSTIATVISDTFTVSSGGTENETIIHVPFGTSKTDFLAALTKGEINQTWNDTSISDPVQSGNIFIVTAQDGITAVAYTVAVEAPILEDNLVTYWSFNNSFAASFGGAGYDLTGFSSDGTPEQSQYMGRNAVKFERLKGQYLKTDSSLLGVGTDFTYMAWYYLTQPISGTDRYFVLEATGTSYPVSYGLRNDGGVPKGQVFVQNANSEFISVADEVYGAGEGKWYNIIVTYDSSENLNTAYINGIQGAAINAEVTESLDGLVIGSYRNQDDRFWQGYIDEVAIWDRMLTEEEIIRLQDTQLISGDKTYTVSYVGNGSDGGTTPKDSSIYEAGTTVIVPGSGDLLKAGYHFVGWNDEKGTIYTEGESFNINEYAVNLTLYAEWEINRYTVSFESNGGSTVDSITADYGTIIAAPAAPAKEGYIFGGWYKEAGLTNRWNFGSDKVPAEDKILYAKWLTPQDSIYITVDPDVVECSDNFNQTFVLNIHNDTVTELVYNSDLTLSGVFSGLNIGQVYSDSTTVTAEVYGNLTNVGIGTMTLNPDKLRIRINPLSVNVTVTAKPTYTVTFIDHDGTVLKREIVEHRSSAAAPANPSREGHRFTGWAGIFDNIISDLEIRAQYEVLQYTVSFESNGGSVVDSITADYGTIIAAPAAPTKEGYIFGGWYKEAGLTNRWNFGSDKVPAEDKILYAKWLTPQDSIYITVDPDVVECSDHFSQIFTISIHNDTVTESVYNSDLTLSGVFSGLSIGEVYSDSTTVTAEVYGDLRNDGIGTMILNPDKPVVDKCNGYCKTNLYCNFYRP